MTPNKSKTNFKKNAIIALLAIIALGLVALIIFNKLNKNDTKLLDLSELSYKEYTFFNIDNSSDNEVSTGVVELTGYAEVVNRKLPRVPDDNYVFFHIINSSSSKFLRFLKRMKEDDPEGLFSREDAIGIGCLDDQNITMVRYADRYYNEDEFSEFSLSLEDSKTIMSSSKDKPVKIIVRKDLDTSLVSEIPHCTTLITSVELVK